MSPAAWWKIGQFGQFSNKIRDPFGFQSENPSRSVVDSGYVLYDDEVEGFKRCKRPTNRIPTERVREAPAEILQRGREPNRCGIVSGRLPGLHPLDKQIEKKRRAKRVLADGYQRGPEGDVRRSSARVQQINDLVGHAEQGTSPGL